MAPHRNKQDSPTTFLDPFENESSKRILEAINQLLLEASSTATQSSGESREHFTNLDIQGTKLLLKHLANSFPVNDPVLNTQLGKRMLKKDRELFALLAALQILFSRTAWTLTCSAKTRTERQQLEVIIKKIHSLGPVIGQEVYRNLKIGQD